MLDGQPYRAELLDGGAALRLTSRDDPRSGIRFSRTISPLAGRSGVQFEATMTNVDTKPRRWGIWAHTQLDAATRDGHSFNPLMRAFCPLNPRSKFPRGYDVIFGEKDNPSFRADRERGHVFTDRLLHARGRDETMILGSATLEPLVRKLVPEAEVISRPRFSTLRHAGTVKLSRLPPRSAVVAFSAEQVYAVAEMLRRYRGGAALVMGAMSPQTRNARASSQLRYGRADGSSNSSRANSAQSIVAARNPRHSASGWAP